ncbi:MAG: hypothetical protein HRT89_09370, partial [Lentisphaeria bacterium]|nr:hypothetical protein [Lentisphaeria bacterium]NQZ68269.1 hypothetical protein [Lentisphaeria bacterium]
KSQEWLELAKNTYAPALNIHTLDNLKKIKEMGMHPWVYNNGLDRYGMGIHLWRGIKGGCEGRMEWTGMFTQGFGFYNLDGREPSRSSFMVHRRFGCLKTSRWLSVREGLLDCRIRLTLEKLATKNDPALLLWTLANYRKDRGKWTDKKLDEARAKMLARLLELSAKKK